VLCTRLRLIGSLQGASKIFIYVTTAKPTEKKKTFYQTDRQRSGQIERILSIGKHPVEGGDHVHSAIYTTHIKIMAIGEESAAKTHTMASKDLVKIILC
jgi:hypothetical protein